MAGKNDAEKIEEVELSFIMRNVSGRNFIRRLLVRSGYFANTFDVEPTKHAYNAGRRSLGCELMSQLQEVTPGELELMLKEHIDG